MQKRINSFGYALRGIGVALRQEPNLRIHALATLLTIGFGIYFSISRMEWALQTIVSGIVWLAELFNTAWEDFLDHAHPSHHPKIGRVKDIAAGAVLLAAITAAIVGAIIYIPYILTALGANGE